MRKTTKTLRAMGYAAPIALTFALAAPVAMGYESGDDLWSAKGEKTVWVTRYGECWKSTAGPTDLSPCYKSPVIVVRPQFEFNKFSIEDVVNKGEIAKIDEYVEQLKATPEKELVTVVGHTDAKGSDEYNLELGRRRAEAVRDYIIARGYPAENVAPPESRGKSELLPDVDPFAVAQRRIDLIKKAL